jgi:hypothetical protein
MAEADSLLQIARDTGMKYFLSMPDITEHMNLVEEFELKPAPALMIGGVYRGRAIDRHLFTFEPKKQRILIEPPVYNSEYAYTRGSGATGQPLASEPIAHYYPDIGQPIRAEIVIPTETYDGAQHIEIVSATLAKAPPDTNLLFDSVSPGMLPSSEVENRQLYTVSFDLTGYENALLSRVGIAVYWPYHGTDQYWLFGHGNVSAWAQSTHEAARQLVQSRLQPWIAANDGTFPSDIIPAIRYGDECFFITGHLNGRAVNYPLWDYNVNSVRAFQDMAGDLQHPRTWGFPEIYGEDAYGIWQYTLHKGTANLVRTVKEEVNRIAPGVLLFRNQTRNGVFHPANDRDGTGQELLSEQFDIVHLDPYPVSGQGYNQNIPRDMSYNGGLARRYNRLLIPWMQAHTYGGTFGLQHVSPDEVARMAKQQYQQGVDGVVWLGYGPNMTFPDTRPESWDRAGEFHTLLKASPPDKPSAQLAVLRPYNIWSLSSRWEEQIRNPADWMLQQFLEVWSVQHNKAYDVFELSPVMTAADSSALKRTLQKYKYIVSTAPYDGAWIIGEDSQGTELELRQASRYQQEFETALKERGWLSD